MNKIVSLALLAGGGVALIIFGVSAMELFQLRRIQVLYWFSRLINLFGC